MTIIDAQVHIWPPETPEWLYVTEDASKPQRLALTREQLLEEAIHVFKDDSVLGKRTLAKWMRTQDTVLLDSAYKSYSQENFYPALQSRRGDSDRRR